MERTFVDDLQWALFVFIGLLAAYLIFARGDIAVLLGGVAGIVLVVLALNVIRLFARGRRT